MRDLRAAFALLSTVPTGTGLQPAPTARAAAWFPWVGLFLGGSALALLTLLNAASVAWGDGQFLPRAAWPIALIVVAGWLALTRLMHADGLADVADAWWGGNDPERRLEIMADSRVGAFGAAAVALAILTQTAAVAVLVGRAGMGIAIFAAPVFARAAATFGAWLGHPARPGGLGAAVAGRPGIAGILICAVGLSLAGASMLYEHGTRGLAWSVSAVLLAAAVPHVLASRFGGITGDVLGASVFVTETFALLAAALVVSW